MKLKVFWASVQASVWGICFSIIQLQALAHGLNYKRKHNLVTGIHSNHWDIKSNDFKYVIVFLKNSIIELFKNPPINSSLISIYKHGHLWNAGAAVNCASCGLLLLLRCGYRLFWRTRGHWGPVRWYSMCF
jgi:hypothetical protein